MVISDEKLFGQLAMLGMDIRDATIPKKRGFHGQGHVLYLLSRNENLSQRELANLAKMQPGSMTEILTRMERDELIERHRDAQDKRVIHVRLTQKGQQAEHDNYLRHQKFCQQLFAPLNLEEKQAFSTLMKKIDQNLKTTMQLSKEGE